jgi:hypothetical protein
MRRGEPPDIYDIPIIFTTLPLQLRIAAKIARPHSVPRWHLQHLGTG